jgi:hypothetical protein
LENLRKYFTLAIDNHISYALAFYDTMARLMALYPQKFTFKLGDHSFNIKADFNSTFL